MEKSASNKQQLIFRNGGFIIIEAVIGVVLASIFLTAFLALNAQAIKFNQANISNFEADMYLNELIEVTKDLEQSDWCELTKPICSSGPCHPDSGSAPEWELLFGTESLESNKFNRSVIISEVYRNQLAFPNNIVTGLGILDPNTKKITAQITWVDGSHSSIILETYAYNYKAIVCP